MSHDKQTENVKEMIQKKERKDLQKEMEENIKKVEEEFKKRELE